MESDSYPIVPAVTIMPEKADFTRPLPLWGVILCPLSLGNKGLEKSHVVKILLE
jgi:hypothetical protein